MTVAVRPVNLNTEREDLLDILGRNLKALPHARRFQWFYYNNPSGIAWSWFVYEKESQKVVGVASVFPRSVWVGNEVKRCGQVADFAIDSTHRSLGPAVMLQRSTFEPVKDGLLGFCYDCPPHESGMSTFRRLGMKANCQMHRYARLLKTDRRMGEYLGQGRLAAYSSRLANLLLEVSASRKQKRAGVEIAQHTDRFGEEFSQLDAQVGGGEVIRGQRKAEDLNWRYRDDPLREYQVLTARQNGELLAFVVFSVSDQDAYIVDLFGIKFPDVAIQLLDAVADHLKGKQKSVQTLHATVSDNNDLMGILQKAGFRYRDKGAQVVAYTQPDTETFRVVHGGLRWSFNHADILA
jgi:hypothetical protein